MRLIAPVVAVVQDRRRPTLLGVLLEEQGQSRLLGALTGIEGEYAEDAAPAIELQTNSARIGARKATLPLLTAPYRSLAACAGFVVASAVDSQRLWILECS
jgi:hypothetical protein